MTQLAITVLTLALIGASSSIILIKVGAYRLFASLAVAILLLWSAVEYGLPGLVAVIVALGVVIPLALTVIARVVIWLTWRNVSKRFLAEPVAPPVPLLSLSGAYRLMWLAD